jgi:putative phosphoesterase
MSDTHGNVEWMHRVADLMVEQFGVSLILHVGDDYPDAEQLDMAGHRVHMVAGLWCDAYRSPRHRWFNETIGGVRIAGCHAVKDLRAVDRAADIVVTGHTHVAVVERIGATIYVNPGHLKKPKDRGQVPSFVTITIDETITVRIHELDGSVRGEKVFARPAR